MNIAETNFLNSQERNSLSKEMENIKRIKWKFYTKKVTPGLPWWRSGWGSACQCRGHGFEPWSGRIPHAAEQLGP